VIGATVAELTTGGWLVPARVFLARTKLDLRGIATVGGAYAKGALGDAVMRADIAGKLPVEERDSLIHNLGTGAIEVLTSCEILFRS
jgi:hypothetical protein